MLDQKKFGEKLRKHRKALGYTQEYAAEQIGVSAQAISKWEAGNCLPDCFNLKALSDLYGISADMLLDTKNGRASRDDVKSLIDRIQRLENAISLITAPNRQFQLKSMLERAKKLYSFDFSRSGDTYAPWAVKAAEVTATDGALSFKSVPSDIVFGKYFDPMLESGNLSIDTQKAAFLHVYFRAVPDNHYQGPVQMNIFFRTSLDNVFNEAKKVHRLYPPRQEFDHLTVDLKSLPFLSGTLTGLRFDFLETSGKMDVQRIYITTSKESGEEILFDEDFTKEGGYESSIFTVKNGEITSTDAFLAYTATEIPKINRGHDPKLINDEISLDIDKTGARYVHIRYKANAANNAQPLSQIYFKTAANDLYTQNKHVNASAPSQMTDVYIDMSANKFWCGTLTGLRADLLECEGVMSVEYIEILADAPETAVGGWINSVEKRLSGIYGKDDCFNFGTNTGSFAFKGLESFIEDTVYDMVQSEVECAVEEAVQEAIQDALDDLKENS